MSSKSRCLSYFSVVKCHRTTAKVAGSARGDHTVTAASSSIGVSRSDVEPNRYIAADLQEDSSVRRLVEVFGADNPEGWIRAVDPKFATGREPWTNNCGDCSRVFADTFQGGAPRAAVGDGKVPPGEYREMWQWAGTQPTSKITNSSANPTFFTTDAYGRMERALRGQPPGTVAIVGVDWDLPGLSRGTAGGHWFNLFVDESGNIKWADAQVGQTAGWPPAYANNIWQIEAISRQPGMPWKEVSL